MDLVGYVRVSRVAGREGESFISPDVQRERISAYASAAGHRIVSWEIDLDEPGSRYERPAFQAAIETVERGEAGGVAVAALDRFARSVPDAALALRRLDQAGGILLSVRDSLDTSTPVGRFARTMMLAIAELELERIRENWRTANERAVARGVHVSRVPPYGYRRGEDGRLIPAEDEAPIVRELYRRRAVGESWASLASWLDEVSPRKTGGAWVVSTLSEMIGRRTYLGEASGGGYTNRVAHLPLVSRAEWEAAQSRTRRPPSRDRGSLLSGLVVCASCSGAMTTSREGQRGYRNYICPRRRASGVCSSPPKIGMISLDRYVESLWLERLDARPVRLRGVATTPSAEDGLRAIDAAEAELIAYRDGELASVLGVDRYREGLLRRVEALDEARRRYADAARVVPDLVRDLRTDWPDLDVAERALVLREKIERIEVRRGLRPTGGRSLSVEERVRILWRPHVTGITAT